MPTPLVLRSLALFLAAGLCEIGGGYLVWLWLRDGRAPLWGALGGAALFLYGVVPTRPPAPFRRGYAAYGGGFGGLSRLGGWPGARQAAAQVRGAGRHLCL